MSRRKQSPLEDMIDIASLLPSWLSLILALLAYIFLHQYALSDVVRVTNSSSQIAQITPSFYRALARGGQYIVPMIFVFGAIISFSKRRKRDALFTKTKALGEVNALLNMSWQEFEQLTGESFKRRGYSVTETGNNGPDGGIDLILAKNSEQFLVQCKQWRAQKVGVNIVRELYGVMAAKGSTGGFIVTSGNFSNEAITFAEGRNIELIGGKELMIFVMPAGTIKEFAATKSLHLVRAPDPSCPVCGNAMVKRVASKGRNAGNAFWGCRSFPQYRGTLNI